MAVVPFTQSSSSQRPLDAPSSRSSVFAPQHLFILKPQNATAPSNQLLQKLVASVLLKVVRMTSYQYGRVVEDTRLPEVMVEPGIEAIYPTPYHGDESSEHGSGAFHIFDEKPDRMESIKSLDQIKRKYYFSQRAKVFRIAMVVALLVVASSLAGGLAGGLAHRSGSSEHSTATIPSVGNTTITPPGCNTTSTVGAFIGSQISAVNWTDRHGQLRRAVFYQSAGNLLASITEVSGSTQTWRQVNISTQFEHDTDWVAPQAGTPLAASAIPWQDRGRQYFLVALFYLDENNLVRQLNSKDDELLEWIRGPEWDSALRHAAGQGTQLGAAAYFCPQGCPNSTDVDRQIWFACGDDLDSRTAIVKAYPGSSQATVLFANNNGKSITVDELQFYYYTDTDVRGDFYNHFKAAVLPSPPQFVACVYDSISKVLVLDLDGNGKLIESKRDYGWDTDNSATFIDGNVSSTQEISNMTISAIALDDYCLYGVSADGSSITQFAWSPNSPLLFQKTSIVVSS
ncbi:hypothetical protein EKO27_g10853 [Xylaria grammica]|uniref:Fucose-specific lectin n=1 Tax=Xylaria grammica TaxID=363999 RepID=A0A439CQ86_9PEZI|nr:hypothetical protein EKO27_g10853 [Xylaria grammica]